MRRPPSLWLLAVGLLLLPGAVVRADDFTAYDLTQENGTAKPRRGTLNFTSGATLTDDSANNRTNIALTGTGDVTDVGNCDGPACFAGAEGFTLTFENASGDQTLSFDNTSQDFELSNDLTITDVGPHIRLSDSTAAQDDYEWSADANLLTLARTDGTTTTQLLIFNSGNQFRLPLLGGAGTQCLQTDVNGVITGTGSACGAGGSGDQVTVNTTAIDTTANLKDTATVTWAVVDGGAGGPDDAQATAIDVTCTNCLTVTEVASADLATLASTITVIDGTDATSFPAIFDSATGDLAIKTDLGLTYAADSGTLSATVLTEGAEAVFNASETPGGELGGTWGTPTLDDSVTVTGWVMGASTATTPAIDDSDTSLATTAFVNAEIDDDLDASAELIALVDDETGTGALMFATNPTVTTGITFEAGTIDPVITLASDNVKLSTGNFVVGATADLAALAVDGAADEIQLLVQGNATQTTNLLVAENSAGTDQLALTNSGNATLTGTLTVGGTAQSTITEGLVVNNGSGTDEDDDFTVNVSGAAYEIDAGAGTFTSTANSFGWSVVAGADTACTTTCTSACVFGVNTASLTADIVDCADTTADECLCAGAN